MKNRWHGLEAPKRDERLIFRQSIRMYFLMQLQNLAV
jgi:hypothetical protein